MKVKKLEFNKTSVGTLIDQERYCFIEWTPNGFLAQWNIPKRIIRLDKVSNKYPVLGYFKTLGEAKECCQEYFNKFILDQFDLDNKIKFLKWRENSSISIVSEFGNYRISFKSAYLFQVFLKDNLLAEFKALEKAKAYCQDQHKQFILSQIEVENDL